MEIYLIEIIPKREMTNVKIKRPILLLSPNKIIVLFQTTVRRPMHSKLTNILAYRIFRSDINLGKTRRPIK